MKLFRNYTERTILKMNKSKNNTELNKIFLKILKNKSEYQIIDLFNDQIRFKKLFVTFLIDCISLSTEFKSKEINLKIKNLLIADTFSKISFVTLVDMIDETSTEDDVKLVKHIIKKYLGDTFDKCLGEIKESDKQIAEKAYFLFKKNGIEGKEIENWLLAEKSVNKKRYNDILSQ